MQSSTGMAWVISMERRSWSGINYNTLNTWSRFACADCVSTVVLHPLKQRGLCDEIMARIFGSVASRLRLCWKQEEYVCGSECYKEVESGKIYEQNSDTTAESEHQSISERSTDVRERIGVQDSIVKTEKIHVYCRRTRAPFEDGLDTPTQQVWQLQTKEQKEPAMLLVIRKEKCRFGSSCQYSHDKNNSQLSSIQEQASAMSTFGIDLQEGLLYQSS